MIFISRSPLILQQWNTFFGPNLPRLPDGRLLLFDPGWPFMRE